MKFIRKNGRIIPIKERTESDITTGGEKLNNLSAQDQAKLDSLLNGNKTATTEQGGAKGNDSGKSTAAPVSSK